MRNCISMKEDEYGAIKPSIDGSSCVQCGMCIKACPNNTPLEFKYPQSCYAAWIKDKVKRRICASGGLGTTFSEYVIKQEGIAEGEQIGRSKEKTEFVKKLSNKFSIEQIAEMLEIDISEVEKTIKEIAK